MKRAFIVFYCLVLGGMSLAQEPVDLLLRAKALIDRGKNREAVSLLAGTSDIKSGSKHYVMRGDAYLADGNYSAASSDYQSANKLSPGSGDYGLSRIYAMKGDVKTSLYHLEMNLNSSFKQPERVIMLDPAFALIENTPEWRLFWKKERYNVFETSIHEIEYCIANGKKDDAQAIANDLSDRYPGYDNTVFARAIIDFSFQKYSESVSALTSLTVKNPDNEQYLRLLAKVQASSGNHSGASVTYGKLISLNIPDAELFIRRAESYRKTGEYQKATRDLGVYLSLYPESKEALSLAGKITSESGDNLKAMDYFSRNLELHPGDPDCYRDRANSYFVSGTWEYAVKDFSMALDLRPDDPDVWLNKGISLLNSGKKDDACHDFRKALNLGNKKATQYISRYCID